MRMSRSGEVSGRRCRPFAHFTVRIAARGAKLGRMTANSAGGALRAQASTTPPRPSRRAFLGATAALACVPGRAFGQSAGKRRDVVAKLVDDVRRNYQDEAAAARLAAALQRGLDAGAYDDDATSEAAFAERLTRDLRAVVDDRHMAVMSGMVGKEPDITVDPAFALKLNYGVQSVRRLAGNVGLIELNFFPSPTFGDALFDRYAAAMTLVRDTRALIVDVREHMGGDPATVAYFASYFFDRAPFVINRIRYRAARVAAFATTATPRGIRYGERRPLLVLTSPRTFSGAEELAYDLQATRRARVVGEVTGGGANPNEAFDLGGGFVAYIPNGAAVNPVTGSNWEGVGVKPDVVVAAAKALVPTQRLALEAALDLAREDDERRSIREALDALTG